MWPFFLDLNMPRLRGDQVARSLRFLLPTVPPLVVVSGETQFDGDRGLFDALLGKPVLLHQLGC
jgi:CheY-like chemotaxis protein